MCLRSKTAGSNQVKNTEVGPLMMAVTLRGTEGTEEERDGDENYKGMTAVILQTCRREMAHYTIAAAHSLTISSVHTALSTERTKEHDESPHREAVLGTRD